MTTTGRGARRRPRTPGAVRTRLPLVAPAAVGVAFIVLPLVALLLRADWADLATHLSAPVVGQSLRLSAVTTAVTMVVVWTLGTPLAWLLARSDHPLTAWGRALVTVPLVLPPVVGGVALLMTWGRRGVLGGWLEEAFGVTLPFTTAAVVMAEIFVAMPFYVISVEGSMRSLDRRFDEVAATLGAGPVRTFRTVVVPMVLPGIAAGSALAWARALGEFGATITFAGSFPGRTQTAPLGVYAALERDPDAAVALSLVMLAVSVLVLGLLRSRWLR
ncbi:ABC transporter permease [Ornithinimicrobium pekingense]|uniref:Molybdenum transport system permease n=1 Tax=Ornithinimicrobium pekingense TaxID=384677 RepID=A0ABQ2FEX7_9MICO|nr:ABC transporter permease [Ornithinimicrobium pekingense]GGK83254.1 molybdate ABC transporter permease [Ornithinimicrobium pekingense]